jgi:hypothetical protein
LRLAALAATPEEQRGMQDIVASLTRVVGYLTVTDFALNIEDA